LWKDVGKVHYYLSNLVRNYPLILVWKILFVKVKRQRVKISIILIRSDRIVLKGEQIVLNLIY